jgi:parallel beta-helix repeat protein
MICVNCVSENNGGAGFTSSTANGSPSVDHVFQGNVAQMNAFHGWQTDVYGPNAERVVLTGNIFSDNKNCGVYCHKGTNISVVGNIINGNGAGTATAAVSLSMSNSITVSNNIIEGDATHGKCIVFNFAGNKVSDVIIADNLCRGSASKTIHIEASDTMTALQRVIASGNIINGGSHGLYVGTSAPGAVLDTVTLVNNIVGNATTASYLISDHALGQSTNVRLVGNTGVAVAVNPNVRLADEKDNSWNSFRGDGAAPPTRGTWLQGAIIFNAVPSPGSPIGWVCTVSGNPGTWNGFGVIGA